MEDTRDVDNNYLIQLLGMDLDSAGNDFKHYLGDGNSLQKSRGKGAYESHHTKISSTHFQDKWKGSKI